MRTVAFALFLAACGSDTTAQPTATGGGGGASADAAADAADAALDASGGSGGMDATPDGAGGSAGAVACPTFAAATVTGTVQQSAITEASGVVSSRTNTDVLYVHNDSGDGPRVFAMSAAGAHLTELALPGAGAQDWEDIAVGPGPTAGQSYLYIGDIGDNPSARANIKIYRVPEPTISGAGANQTLPAPEVFTLTYEDGPHNAEALLVDPIGGQLLIVTKTNSGPAQVFQSSGMLPSGGGTFTLKQATTLAMGSPPLSGSQLVTGGDVSPAGDLVALRTYSHVWLFRRQPGQPLATAFAGEPCPAPSQTEPQGEAVGFAKDGGGYFTVSEGKSQPLHFFAKN